MGGSLLTQGWGAGRGRLAMCSPALPPSPLGRTGRLEPLGSVIGSGRGDRVSDPLAQTKGSLLSVERGARSGLAVDNASCPAGKSSSTGLSLTNTQLKPQQSVERMCPSECARANAPAPRLTWLAAAGAASVSSFLASLVIGRSEDGRRVSGAEPHDGPTMGHSAGLFHYLAFPQGSI